MFSQLNSALVSRRDFFQKLFDSKLLNGSVNQLKNKKTWNTDKSLNSFIMRDERDWKVTLKLCMKSVVTLYDNNI